MIRIKEDVGELSLGLFSLMMIAYGRIKYQAGCLLWFPDFL